jgi:hypothetical protein
MTVEAIITIMAVMPVLDCQRKEIRSASNDKIKNLSGYFQFIVSQKRFNFQYLSCFLGCCSKLIDKTTH